MAIDFNGTTDRIDYPSAFTTSGSAFSYSGWHWFDVATPTGGAYLFNSAQSGGGGGTIVNQEASGSGRVQFARLTNATAKQRVTNTILSTGVWAHVCITDTATLGTGTDIHIYIDGTEATYLSTVNGTGTEIVANSGFSIGGRVSDDLRNFNGRTADPAVWNRVISSKEIAMLAARYSPLFCPNGIMWYAPLIREATNPYNNTAPTLDGTTVIEHPRIYRPRGVKIYSAAQAAQLTGGRSTLLLMGVG